MKNPVSRRSVLGTAAAIGGSAIAAGIASNESPARAASIRAGQSSSAAGQPPVTVLPNDPRYADLVTGNNQRWVAHPEYIRMVTSTSDAQEAVQAAVDAGKRISVRSGGHCFAGFVSNPQVEAILDLSEMNSVYYDDKYQAVAIQPGARLLNVYEQLYKSWNSTIPGGICYSVGIGGHVAGGGYGLLSRQHGLTVDHLYGIEIVVVNSAGKAQTVVATCDENDPNRDLWWAHTGGGGGNFGIVTKYLFRSPNATPKTGGLVTAPSTVLVSDIEFPWSEMDQTSFSRLIKNFGAWHEKNSSPDSPYCALSSLFNVTSKANGSLGMFTQVDGTVPNAEQLMQDFLDAITNGVKVAPVPVDEAATASSTSASAVAVRRLPWIQATRLVGTNDPVITDPTMRGAHKSAYMRTNFTDSQINTLYGYLTQENFHNPNTMLVLFSFGGQVNAVAPDATATAQREAVLKMCFQTFWPEASDDSFYLGWIRDLYQEFFKATGGVPVPNDTTDGCYINYPDVDVASPHFNRSGVPWHKLYYKDNYPRLQQVKRKWDPTNFFRHQMSIEGQ